MYTQINIYTQNICIYNTYCIIYVIYYIICLDLFTEVF